MAIGKNEATRDPTMTTSGDPRQDQPLGGGGATGPNPALQQTVRTGDRNARGSQDPDARDLNSGRESAAENTAIGTKAESAANAPKDGVAP